MYIFFDLRKKIPQLILLFPAVRTMYSRVPNKRGGVRIIGGVGNGST